MLNFKSEAASRETAGLWRAHYQSVEGKGPRGRVVVFQNAIKKKSNNQHSLKENRDV